MGNAQTPTHAGQLSDSKMASTWATAARRSVSVTARRRMSRVERSHPAKTDESVSKALDKVIAKATALSEADRYTTAKEFAQALLDMRVLHI